MLCIRFGSVENLKRFQQCLCPWVLDVQLNDSEASVAFNADDALFFQNFEVRHYLVVGAVDYADEVGQVGFSDVVKGQQYFLPGEGS